MKMRYFLLHIFMFISVLASASGLEHSIDSLKKELTKKNSNLSKVKIYLDLASTFRKVSPDSSLKYADLAYDAANDNTLKNCRADAILLKGIAFYTKGELNASKMFFLKALEYSVAIKYAKGIVKSYNSIGNYYFKIAQYDSSLANYDKALNIARQQKLDEDISKAIGNMAPVYAKKGDYNKALELYTEALDLADKKSDMEQVALLVEKIGNVFNDKGEYLQALDYYKQSLAIKKKRGDLKGMAESYANIGNVYFGQDRLLEAIDAHYQSLRINEKIGNKSSMATSYMTLGSLNHKQKNIKEALDFYEKAKNLILEMGDKTMLSVCYRYIGNVYQGNKKYDISKKYYYDALKIAKEIGDEKGIRESYNILGNFFQETKNFDEALKYFQFFLDKSKSIDNSKGVAEAYISLGGVYLAQQNVKKAIDHCNKGYFIIVDNGGPLIKQAACECLSDAYNKAGKSDSAYKYLKLYYSFRDSLKSEEISKTMYKRSMDHNYEKKKIADSLATANKEKVLQIEHDAESRKQKLYIYVSLGAFLITLILAIGIFTNFRLKQQSAKIIKKQKEMVEEKNAEIMSSIRYAQRIQNALLTSDEHWDAISQDYFVMLKPKDVVSGDFYWAHYFNDNKAIWVAADCTGHGVPGAFMSMLGIGFLNEIVIEDNIQSPDEILNRLRTKIINALRQKGVQHQQMDGMDLALCLIDKSSSRLFYAGANNPLWIMRNKEIIEIGADKQPVGYLIEDKSHPFTMHEIALQKGDTVYTFTDGYADQFGGEQGKKYKYKRFRELLKSVESEALKKQKEIIEEAFETWKGNHEQVDDVCIIGVKFN